MPTSIDRFSTYGNLVIITGWSSEYTQGQLEVLVHNEPIQILSMSMTRSDVAVHYGPGSEAWGFRVCGMSQNSEVRGLLVGIRFAPGGEIQSVSKISPPPHDHPHALFNDFVDEANTKGGTVLEIGSRARSGHTQKQRFGPMVNYIGLDVSPGENVDIIGDAHHLPSTLYGSVDYVFSVSTFEHFLMPWKVALEINKVLKIGGKVFSHSHQTWPCHDEPWDFFRFSREAWTGLFNKHTGFRLCDARRGDGMSIMSEYSQGGPFDGLEAESGYGISVCVAEKIDCPTVSWDSPVSDVQITQYNH